MDASFVSVEEIFKVVEMEEWRGSSNTPEMYIVVKIIM